MPKRYSHLDISSREDIRSFLDAGWTSDEFPDILLALKQFVSATRIETLGIRETAEGMGKRTRIYIVGDYEALNKNNPPKDDTYVFFGGNDVKRYIYRCLGDENLYLFVKSSRYNSLAIYFRAR